MKKSLLFLTMIGLFISIPLNVYAMPTLSTDYENDVSGEYIPADIDFDNANSSSLLNDLTTSSDDTPIDDTTINVNDGVDVEINNNNTNENTVMITDKDKDTTSYEVTPTTNVVEIKEEKDTTKTILLVGLFATIVGLGVGITLVKILKNKKSK